MALEKINDVDATDDVEGTTPSFQQRAQLDSGLNFLFLAAFPMLLWVFQNSFAEIATAIALMWVLSLALRLISVGQQFHHAYDQAEVACAPLVPRKLIGSIMIGGVVLVLAGHKYDTLWIPVVAGLVASGLSLAAFGLDPMRKKGSDRVLQVAAVEVAELALASLTDRVGALEDAELSTKTEAARRLVLHPMRQSTGDPKTSERLARPVHKVIAILENEVTRLETAWNSQGHRFARRRYLAKLDVLTESYEAFAVHSGVRGARDPFERKADQLLDRMPRESAA